MANKSPVLSMSQAAEKRNNRTIEQLAAETNRKLGEGTIVRASDMIALPKRMSTGSLWFDLALGGGWPANAWSEIISIESAGKTALALSTVAFNMKRDPKFTVMWCAAEAFDADYARGIGVDLNRMWVLEENTMEIVYEKVGEFVTERSVDMAVIDAYPSLITDAEDTAFIGDAQVSPGARLTGKFMRTMTKATKRSLVDSTDRPFTGLFINQWRCLDKDTNIWTSRGLIPISEVVPGDYVAAPGGERTLVRATKYVGTKNGVCVRGHHAAMLNMSNDHRQPVVVDAEVVEVLGVDLRPGMWLQLSNEAQGGDGSQVDLGEAAFAGAYFADGCVTHSRGSGRVSFTEVNVDRANIVRNLFQTVFNHQTDGRTCLTMGSKAVAWINNRGLAWNSPNKTVPEWVRTGSVSVQREFIRYASFDTHKFERNRFYWTFESVIQTKQFRSLLAGFGVQANVVGNPDKHYQYLSISGDDACKYRDLIGFAEPRKQQLAVMFSYVEGARGTYDVVPAELSVRIWDLGTGLRGRSSAPHASSIRMCLHKKLNASRSKLIDYLEWVVSQGNNSEAKQWLETLQATRYSEIRDVTACIIDAVDIEVDGGLFVAEGIVTHNSKVGISWGDPRTTPGGMGKNFWFAARVELTRTDWIKDDDGFAVGQSIKLNVFKNKSAPPRREGVCDFYFAPHDGHGFGDFDTAGEVYKLCTGTGVVERRGNTYYWGDQKMATSQRELEARIRSEEDLCASLAQAICKHELGTPDKVIETVAPRATLAERRARRTRTSAAS